MLVMESSRLKPQDCRRCYSRITESGISMFGSSAMGLPSDATKTEDKENKNVDFDKTLFNVNVNG